MGRLDGKLAKAIAAAIKVGGATVYLRWFKDGEYDTTSRTKDRPEEFGSPHQTQVAYKAASDHLPADGVVRPGDRVAVLNNSGLPHTPRKGMVVEFADADASKPRHKWLTVSAREIATGDQVAAYELVLRQ